MDSDSECRAASFLHQYRFPYSCDLGSVFIKSLKITVESLEEEKKIIKIFFLNLNGNLATPVKSWMLICESLFRRGLTKCSLLVNYHCMCLISEGRSMCLHTLSYHYWSAFYCHVRLSAIPN